MIHHQCRNIGSMQWAIERRRALTRCSIGLALALAIAGCTLPLRADLPIETGQSDPTHTALYQMVSSKISNDGRSGFRFLPVAAYAFDTRLALAQKAQKTLDVQYYIFKDDQTGKRLMRALADAASRGVHVRVIVDDLASGGEDRLLADLNAIPNVQVRTFNPFAGGRASTWQKMAGAVFDLERIDRRMHNKLFIADDVTAVLGGRNIADEYFMQSKLSNFVDLDIFAAGPVARQLSTAFDSYWNSPHVYPFSSVAAVPPNKDAAIAEFHRLVDVPGPSRREDLPVELALFQSLPQEIEAGEFTSLLMAHADAIVDDPDKAFEPLELTTPTVTHKVLAKIGQSEHSVDLVSPYFVPGDFGMEMIRSSHTHHGMIRLFTNSLAANDSPFAGYGYMQYRQAMLEQGVEIYEISPQQTRDRKRLGPFAKSLGSLHAKCVIVDERYVFLGSMNLDFRSSYKNTEMGVIIDSPELVKQITGLVDLDSFYRLSLDSSDDIEWTTQRDGHAVIETTDPETTWWQRLVPSLFGPLVPQDDL